ncbi:MAG: HD domain-containing protein [Caldilineales bacterium]|nr:HD domain-containing protein [Caldilineales bacterium]MDW8319446.1 HD domain-containing protein [Anaerolineae bacterium]
MASPATLSPTPWQRLRYRAGQLLMSLRPEIEAEERNWVEAALGPEAAALFWRMAPRDRRHSLNVAQALRRQGHRHPDLLAAALLHDVGKTVQDGRPLRLRHRVVIVLLNALRPGLVSRLASPDPQSWRHPYYVHLHHPEQSAALAQAAGCSPLAVELIRRHQEKLAAEPRSEADRLLALLQAADDVN